MEIKIDKANVIELTSLKKGQRKRGWRLILEVNGSLFAFKLDSMMADSLITLAGVVRLSETTEPEDSF